MATQEINLDIVKDFPRNWEVVSLFEVAENHDNKRQPIKSTERENMKGPYPYCGANGVIDYINTYKLDGEYVLVAEDGGYWGKGENTAYIMNGKFFVNNHAHILKAIKGKTENKFLKLMLNYLNIDPLIGGDARGKLTKTVLMNLPFPLPRLSEQKSIAQKLTIIQEAITGQEELITKLKELKRSMMQYLFTRGTKGEKTKMTEVGEIPESWEVIKLRELCDLLNGYAFKSSDYIGKSNTLNIRMSNIKPNGVFDIEYNKKYLPDDHVKKYSDFIIGDGDIVIAMTDMANNPKILGIPTIIKNSNGRSLLLNQRVGKLIDIDTSRIDVHFLQIVLSLETARNFFKSVAKKGVQINLGKGDILSVYVPLPGLREQQKISGAIICIDQKIEIAQEKLSAHQSLFKTLLHELMSGKDR